MTVAIPGPAAVTLGPVAVATPGALEVQTTMAVTSAVVPSENVPVAMNDTVPPTTTVAVGGVTVMPRSAAAPRRITVALPATEPSVAVMVVAPAALPVTSPWEPAALETEATPGALEVHVARVVTSAEDPSEKVPVARRDWVPPTDSVAVAGSRVIPVSVAAVTVTSARAVNVPTVAMITAVPTQSRDRHLGGRALETPATARLVLNQNVVAVRSAVVPSEYVPVTVNAPVPPTASVRDAGAMVISVSRAVVTVTVLVPVTPSRVAVITAVPGGRSLRRPCGRGYHGGVAGGPGDPRGHVCRGAVRVRCRGREPYTDPRGEGGVAPGVTRMLVERGGSDHHRGQSRDADSVAVTVTVPGMNPVTTPWKPGALDTGATVGPLDAQVTAVVMSAVEPSEYVPVARRVRKPPPGSLR